MAVLSDDQVGQALDDLPGWERHGDEIVREVRFDNFRDAVAFVARISFEAEAANHHPDIDIRYNRVRLSLTSHDQGGITDKDLDLARAVQGLAP